MKSMSLLSRHGTESAFGSPEWLEPRLGTVSPLVPDVSRKRHCDECIAVEWVSRLFGRDDYQRARGSVGGRLGVMGAAGMCMSSLRVIFEA